jgi:mannosylglycerate hydrolase
MLNPDSKLIRLAKEYLTPLVSYNKMPFNAMKLKDASFTTPYSCSLIKETADNTTLSIQRKAVKSDELVMCVFNTNGRAVKLVKKLLKI